jgi:HEPN domain-containing protein
MADAGRQTRYPNGLPCGIPADVYQEEDAKQAVVLANEVIGFVSGKIK